MKLLTPRPSVAPAAQPAPSIPYIDCTPDGVPDLDPVLEPAPDVSVQECPAARRIVAVTPLTWKAAGLPVSKVRINDRIRYWMDHDAAIRNWVNGCVSLFAHIRTSIDMTCPVPDQWREDLGAESIHLEKFKDDVIRVMA